MPDLPDDITRWPADPFELLGLAPSASEADAKRAYTKLIRRFKPEHHPDQFRRVREAYEAALDRMKWFGFERQYLEPEPPTPAPEPPPPDVPADAPTRRVVGGAYIDEAKAAWDAAIDGRTDEAYSSFVELARARPERTDLPLRLYWLLALDPALDSSTTRHRWLAEALKRSNLGGSAAELYRRELRADPMVVSAKPYAGLLSHPAPAENLRAVSRWRLTAAALSGRVDLHDDLVAVRERLAREDETGWLELVFLALDFVAWERTDRAYAVCRDALAELKHLELSHAHAFDRLDELEHLAASWREAKNWGVLPFAVLDAVRAGWALPYEESWPLLEDAAEEVAGDPSTILDLFAETTGQQAAVLLAYFTHLLDRHARLGTHGARHNEVVVRALVWEFMSPYEGINYHDLRRPLIDFMTAEAILPDEFVAVCQFGDGLRDLGDIVSRDGPLRCVWLSRYILVG